jgi:UDP-N-acetyl-D-glucosamine dehydrogenase
VIGFDVDPAKVSQLNAGQSYIRHIEAGRIHHLRSEKRFEATSDFKRLWGSIASLFVFRRR